VYAPTQGKKTPLGILPKLRCKTSDCHHQFRRICVKPKRLEAFERMEVGGGLSQCQI